MSGTRIVTKSLLMGMGRRLDDVGANKLNGTVTSRHEVGFHSKRSSPSPVPHHSAPPNRVPALPLVSL